MAEQKLIRWEEIQPGIGDLWLFRREGAATLKDKRVGVDVPRELAEILLASLGARRGYSQPLAAEAGGAWRVAEWTVDAQAEHQGLVVETEDAAGERRILALISPVDQVTGEDRANGTLLASAPRLRRALIGLLALVDRTAPATLAAGPEGQEAQAALLDSGLSEGQLEERLQAEILKQAGV